MVEKEEILLFPKWVTDFLKQITVEIKEITKDCFIYLRRSLPESESKYTLYIILKKDEIKYDEVKEAYTKYIDEYKSKGLDIVLDTSSNLPELLK